MPTNRLRVSRITLGCCLTGWPDDADWRDIDADLIELLSNWEHPLGKAVASAQALVDSVGPPARMVIRRNGGMQFIKNVSDTVQASFTDTDVREMPDLVQHEDSVINSVTVEGTTLGSLNSTVRNTKPLDYRVLDGLAASERVNVIRRILRAYENGLTTIDLDFHADNDRNQASVAALEPGQVIELDSVFLGQTYQGPVSGLRWRWEGVRAFVQTNMEIRPPPPTQRVLTVYMTGTTRQIPDLANRLFFLNLLTGVATTVDVGEANFIRALGYDSDNDFLYGTRQPNVNDQSTEFGAVTELGRINVSTGVGTAVATVTPPNGDITAAFAVNGLAYDSIKQSNACRWSGCWRWQ